MENSKEFKKRIEKYTLNIVEKDEFINRFSKLLMNDNAAFFLGSGMSLGCGMPSWFELLEETYKGLYNNDRNIDHYFAADYYVRQNSRERLNRLLSSKIPKDSRAYGITVNHRIITRLPISEIWTTNYDKVIERAFEERNKDVIVFKKDQDITADNFSKEVKVYKIHGCIDDPESMVVTQTDVQYYHRNFETMEKAFFSKLASRTFLFLGFGFKDVRFDQSLANIFTRYNGTGREHYAILPMPNSRRYKESAELERAQDEFIRQVYQLEKYNIKVLPISSFDEIPIILKDIEKKILRKKAYVSGSVKPFIYSTHNLDKDNAQLYDYNGVLTNKKEPKDLLKFHKHMLPDDYGREFESFKLGEKPAREIIEHFANELGSSLVASNRDVHCGNGEVITNAVVEGAFDAFTDPSQKRHTIPSRVKILPMGKPHTKKDQMDLYKSQFLMPCGFMIHLRGGFYSNDFYSGTLEEYMSARRMTSVIFGWQSQMVEEINEWLNPFNVKKLDSKSLKESFKVSNADSLLANAENVSNKLDGLITKQSEMIYYKYHEIIGIFRVQFYKLWKLNNKNIEYKRGLLIQKMIELRELKLPKSIEKHFDFISKEFSNFQIAIAKFFLSFNYNQCDDFLAKKDEKLLSGLSLFSACKEAIKETGKEKNHGNYQALNKILTTVCQLLQGHYKYFRIAGFAHEFTKLEIEYTSYLIDDNQDEKRTKGLLETFQNYEKKMIELLKDCLDGTNNFPKKKANDIGDLETYYKQQTAFVGKILNNLLDSTEVKQFSSKHGADNQKYFLRLFLINHFRDVFPIEIDACEEVGFNESYLEKMVRHHSNKCKSQSEFYKSLKNDCYKEIINKEENIHSRRYILIYRMQMYKILQWVADLERAYGRQRHDINFTEIQSIRKQNELEGIGLLSLNLYDPNGDHYNEKPIESNKKVKINVHNPLVNDPNDLIPMKTMTYEYSKYYRDNLNIHRCMVNIKHILAKARLEMSSWQLPSKKTSKTDYEKEFKKIRFDKIIVSYDNLIKNYKKIIQIMDSQRGKGYFGEAYRSATIIIPIGFYEGVTKKIWEYERFRFELLIRSYERTHGTNSRTNLALKHRNISLLRHYYNLNFASDIIERDNRCVMVTHKEQDLKKIEESIIHSVGEIMEAFS